MIIISIIILIIYLICPLVGKIALLTANTFIPDPIPFVDEIIMWIGLLSHLSRLMNLAIFIRNHKILTAFLIIAAIIVLIIIF